MHPLANKTKKAITLFNLQSSKVVDVKIHVKKRDP